YNQSGGVRTVGGYEFIGYTAAGNYIQSGGTHTVGSPTTFNGNLRVSNYVGSSGSYSLSGSGSLTVNGEEDIGIGAAATFTQSGGTHNVGSAAQTFPFYVGRNTGGSGAYTLSNGNLNVFQDAHIGYSGNATFTQTGGTHSIGAPSYEGRLIVGERTGG